MDWIADLSFGHDAMTGTILDEHQVPGVIGYVSDDPSKNLSRANLIDHLAHNRAVGLVFEDTIDDMHGDPGLGFGHGVIAVNEAAAIGYDWQHCVIFAADDRNTGPADWPNVLAYMENFATRVPVVGYYGDQDSIDYLAARHPEWFYWQSDSTSYGSGVSRHADLIQRFNDPRVAGLPMDASDILRQRVPFMGDDMFTDADRATLARIEARAQHADYTAGLELPAIAEIRGNAQNTARAVLTLHTAPDPAALAAALAPLLHQVPAAELQAALSEVLAKVSLTVEGD